MNKEASLAELFAQMTRAYQERNRAVGYLPRAAAHLCYPDVCFPESAEELLGPAYAVPSPYAGRLFVCRDLATHACLADACDRIERGTCPISGRTEITESAYLRADPRTYDADPIQGLRLPPTSKPTPSGVIDAETRERIDALLTQLLFVCPERVRANEATRQRLDKEFQTDLRSYLEQCVNQSVPPNQIHAQALRSRSQLKLADETLECVELVPETVNYYARIVERLLLLIQRHGPATAVPAFRSNLTTITLALLYKMRHGYTLDGLEVVPLDYYLLRMLPLKRDLPHFRLQRNETTKGEQIINVTLASAIRAGEVPRLLDPADAATHPTEGDGQHQGTNWWRVLKRK